MREESPRVGIVMCRQRLSIPADIAVAEASRSLDEFYNVAYEHATARSRWNYYLMFLALGVANSGDATEISCMNYILSHPLFKEEIIMADGRTEDYARRGAAIASSIFAGMLIGGILTGSYGDRWGRRPTLLSGLFVNAISGLSSSVAQTATMMGACRFSAGLGIGAVLSSLITLAGELSPSARRGRLITAVGGFWTLGSVFIAFLAYVLFGRNDYSWRIFVLIAASPTLLGGAMVWALVPESPRFLALHGRYEEAATAANAIAASMGYAGRELTERELRAEYGALAEDEADAPRRDEPALRKIYELYGKGLARTVTIPLQVVWFSMSFGSGLCTWITKLFEELGLANIYLQSLYFAAANVPGNVAAAALVDRVGRKPLLCGSMTGAALCLGLAAHGARETRQTQVILASCLFHSFLVAGWCALSVMTSESFPTSVRGTGVGVCSGVGRVAGILVQYVNSAFIGQPLVLLLVASSCMMAGALAPIILKMHDLTNQNLSEVPVGLLKEDRQLVKTV